MDREILFRGKRVDNGEWVYGYVVSVLERSRATIFVPKSATESEWATLPYAVDPATIGQYTGLTDKNGKKIFEGDVVLKRIYRVKANRKVVFSFGCFHCGFGGGSSTATHPYLLDDKQIEVIGNTHDNPELLEERA